MKTVLFYSAALLALCVLIFRKDRSQPELSGSWAVRITCPEFTSRDEAKEFLKVVMGITGIRIHAPIGQLLPTEMLP